MIRIEYSDGSQTTIPYVKSQEDRQFNKQWAMKVTVDRAEVNAADPQEGIDEIYLEVDGVDEFGGILRDIKRTGKSTATLLVDSFERYARKAEPTGTGVKFGDVDDTVVISNAIGRVSELTEGTLDNIKGGLTFKFNNVSPAKMIRTVRDTTKGEIAYRPDKSVDVVSSLGADKTATTLSPSNQNIESFKLTRSGGSKRVNHLRMLGGGTGDAQTVVNVVADSFQSGDREIWGVHPNKEIYDSSTLREQGKELVNEMSERHIEAKVTIRDVTVNLGDEFRLTYPEEDVDRDVRVVELKTIRDKEGTYYKAVVSNRQLSRYASVDKTSQDVERFNREGGGQVISTYDNPTQAPQEEGNLVYVTGANSSYDKGVYYHNGSNYENTLYGDVQSDNVMATDSLVLPVGTDQQDTFVLPTGTDKYRTS